jgi:mannose/cellobiose epimerase-like protein (N-acyl-D-glucosamine 2-epimerase family)
MAENEKGNKPVKKYRRSGIEVAMWRNESEKGEYYTYSWNRSYKDKDSDEWKQTQNLRENDLIVLANLLMQATQDRNKVE